MKFALRNYAGNPVRYYHVDTEAVDTASPNMGASSAPTHHIAILDVSGSMYGDLDSVKSVVEKVFTLDEFNDPNQCVSLISYASNGDCRVHFQRVPVSEVMAPNSRHLAEIRNLRTRGCTGISQALIQAEKLIDDGDVTCISLHTDGYANDPSPYVESQALMAAADKLQTHPNVFCNTIGYRSYCDFPLLTAIANKLSGICQQANSAKDVYTAIHKTQTLLAANLSPTIEAGIGKYDFVAFLSKKAGKVLGGTASLMVRGIKAGDDATIFRYREVTEAEFKTLDGSEWPQNTDAALVYARTQVALGNLNAAKYAMISTRIGNLIRPHAKAMVATEIAEWSSALEQFLFEPTTCAFQSEYGLGETGPSVLSVLSMLNLYHSGLRVNVPELAANYRRRGLKRIPGTRNEDGSITPPSFKLRTQNDVFVSVSGVDINNDTATANIRLVQDAALVRTSDDQVVTEVAGIRLALKSYRNYTVVSDGSVNTRILPIQTNDKRLFAWLSANNLVTGDFDPQTTIRLDLGSLPLVDYHQTFTGTTKDDFVNIVRLSVFAKLLSGLNKGESESFTGEQIAELKAHCLSPALYFSGPTTTPYADLQAALANGEVDSRNSYKIQVGTPDILNVGKLYSGNAYLQRRFTLEGSAKPTLPDFWEPDAKWGIKELSSRTKVDAIDDIAYPIYSEFLGLATNGSLRKVMDLIDGDEADLSHMLQGTGLSKDERVSYFADLYRRVSAKIDRIYASRICPLAFYVGSTGLVPDGLNAVALNAEQLIAKYPEVGLGKSEREGMFYELPSGVILSVYTTAPYFSTDRGVEVAKKLSTEDVDG